MFVTSHHHAPLIAAMMSKLSGWSPINILLSFDIWHSTLAANIFFCEIIAGKMSSHISVHRIRILEWNFFIEYQMECAQCTSIECGYFAVWSSVKRIIIKNMLYGWADADSRFCCGRKTGCAHSSPLPKSFNTFYAIGINSRRHIRFMWQYAITAIMLQEHINPLQITFISFKTRNCQIHVIPLPCNRILWHE